MSNVRDYNVGKSDYSKHKIQPWDIWKEYNLNPWDADIVKRVLRSKEGEARTLDYEKIIHICKYRIAELSKEVLKETKVVAPVEEVLEEPKTVAPVKEVLKEPKTVAPVKEEKPVWDGESDDTTVFCLDETKKPAMYYIEGTKWNGKYVGYSVFMAGNTPYMYLGVDAEGCHLYATLSTREHWYFTPESHLPPRTFKLKYTSLFDSHRSSLKIGYLGTLYVKHDYIITDNEHLLRYFGTKGNKFSYRDMSAKRADGSYPEFLSNVKLENKAIQFTL